MSEATQYAADAAPAQPVKPTSFWEDVIEIFVHPADVYRRRADKSVWPPMLFVAIAIGIISIATFNTTMAPIMDAEFTRNTAKVLEKNPQLTAESMNKMRDFSMGIAKYTLPVIMLLSMFIVGAVSWLVSKLFGAVTTFHQALVIAAWAYFPRVLGTIAGGIQGLVMDPSRLNSALSITVSPARFMDPDHSNPILYQIAGRLDLFILWETVLLAVGFYVTGKISKNAAAVFGVVMLVVGSLYAIRNGYMLT